MATTSKAPVKPIKFEPGHTYLHITYSTPEPPAAPPISSEDSSIQVKYVGPVGELKGVGIYQVLPRAETGTGAGEGEMWKRYGGEVERALKGLQGVTGVKVMEAPKQRAKRDEF